MSSFASDVAVYVGRIREFEKNDWAVYAGWVGLMLGLVLSTGGFLLLGHSRGIAYPGEAWMVPLGALVFAISISIDTIGHRTIYKEEISRGEGLVHGITIFCGIGSCVLLCAAYQQRALFWVPAMVLTVLSFVYSLVDEVFHWRRYVSQQADRVEMWSHVGIFVGHLIMMLGWWAWFFAGYPGVAETLAALGRAPS
ncbi:MAG: hypothetical protein KF718_30650 [Polyangiaceae bacterium]|nr:hypothetical protein [Polyangiaceae bacterium]